MAGSLYAELIGARLLWAAPDAWAPSTKCKGLTIRGFAAAAGTAVRSMK